MGGSGVLYSLGEAGTFCASEANPLKLSITVSYMEFLPDFNS